MSDVQRKGGKKNRKHGRVKRRPSHNRYTIEMRWIKNKARKAAKIKKAMKRKAARKIKRG